MWVDNNKSEVGKLFPSPCGVSFILINAYQICVENGKEEFPSPYGVSFILINSILD